MSKKIDKVKYKLPMPDVPGKIFNTALGRGIAEVIAEKQERIDRLEQMILVIYENVCHGVKSQVWYDDDKETCLFSQIIEEVNRLKTNDNAKVRANNE